MNKLEEYRDIEWKRRSEISLLDAREDMMFGAGIGFRAGFDAAIALDLPVKFAGWYESKEESWKEWRREHYLLGGSELRERAYRYWIDNIYKPE